MPVFSAPVLSVPVWNVPVLSVPVWNVPGLSESVLSVPVLVWLCRFTDSQHNFFVRLDFRGSGWPRGSPGGWWVDDDHGRETFVVIVKRNVLCLLNDWFLGSEDAPELMSAFMRAPPPLEYRLLWDYKSLPPLPPPLMMADGPSFDIASHSYGLAINCCDSSWLPWHSSSLHIQSFYCFHLVAFVKDPN